MKARKTRVTTSLVLFATIVFATTIFLIGSSASRAMPSTQGQAEGLQSRGGRIEGTWRVHVTQRNCETGAEIRSFPAMLTFAQGGTLTGTTTAFPPSLRGPDHGVWNHHGAHRYGAVSEAFLFSPAGAWALTQRITQVIQLSPDADSFTSDASVEFFDTLGNTTSTGCATAVATRME